MALARRKGGGDVSELPEGWVQIGDLVTDNINRKGPSGSGNFVYVDIGSVDRASKMIVDAKSLPVTKAPSRAKQVLQSGDVLVSMTRPNLNAVAIVPKELNGAIGSTGFHVLRTKHADPRFLFYAVQTRSFIDEMCLKVQGALYPAVRPNDISAYLVPLFPLAEQERIVAKIEELFSELDAGEESLRRARRQLGVYRQSLLKQAFEGKLTAPRLVEKVPLRKLITGLSQGWSPKCDLNRPPEADEWAVIRTTAIQHCRYDDSEAKPLPASLKPRPAIEIQDGDFLMTRKGPRVRAGVTCYVHRTRPRLMICDTVYRFRCVEGKVFPPYLELALNSPEVLHAIDQRKAGINESGLSLTHTKIGTVEIPLCSLPEQQEIVRLLDAQFEVIEQNEREIDAALKRSEALRQSILKKAFTGQLVPQDPTDEPASVLLERIRAGRDLKPSKPKKRAI